MAVKTRIIPGQTSAGTLPNTSTPYSVTLGGGSESIETFGHNIRGLGGPDDVGGPMFLSRIYGKHNFAPLWYNGKPYDFRYISSDTAGNDPLSDSGMRSFGTTAIARTTPTSPLFSASTALGELTKDGVPTVVGVQSWRDRAKKARAAGSEYLNYEFGWIPLVNDIRNFCGVVRDHHQLLADFRAGSGQVTRVGYHFPSSGSTVQGSGNVLMAFAGDIGWSTTAPSAWVKQSEQKTWFKGAFTYHIPVGKTAADKAARFASYANHLYGVRLTPEVLWNLAPWTWALDWFSNAGDVIHNISSIGHDGLVLKYGYIMNHSRTTYSIGTPGKEWYMFAGSYFELRESKKRLPANPYSGFSVNPGPLTATQSAILVALGLSRTH